MKGAQGLLEMAHQLIISAEQPSEYWGEAADRWLLYYIDYLAQPATAREGDKD